MARLYNLARMTTATVGTGTITLGSAVDGCLSFASAGVQNGDIVSYAIQDGNQSEVGRGTYTASGTTLARTTVLHSTNGGSAIILSGNAEVFIIAAAEDIAFIGAMAYMTADDTAVNPTGGYTLSFDAARYDVGGWWAAGSPTRMTVPVNVSKVDVAARVRVSSITNDVMCQLNIQHYDSSNVLIEQWGNSTSQPSGNVFASVNGIGIPVSAGDYFVAILQTTTDTSVTVESELFQTALSIKRCE